MDSFTIPNVPNVSLVAFYNHKPNQLTGLIQELQTYLAQFKSIETRFISYPIQQIHGTIIGCEGLKTKRGIINKWFYEHQQETRYINLLAWLNYLQNQVVCPINLRFASYQPTVNYNFLSRQQHPFIRSFQLQQSGEKITIPILIGWSEKNNQITLELDRLRRQAQRFNLLHKYHNLPSNIDNDFYLRLGTIEGKLESNIILTIEQEIRAILQAKAPLYLSLQQEHLAFVRYQDLSLPVATTEILPLSEATQSKLEGFYCSLD